jgi:hypothetical protein
MKRFAVLLLSLLIASTIAALEVDKTEIAPGKDGTTIEFVNYNGPHSVINSVAEIEGIGTELGDTLLAKGSAGDQSRYYIIHAVDTAVPTGFDADILVLGDAVGVDHIDNLRRILSSYLSKAYGYSKKDASTLATFITVYNAVYRGKLDSFSKRYKPVVVKNLTAEKVGLSVKYNEWPGRSQIVIPLSEARLAGTVSSIDTTTITDKNVVSRIKEDENSGIDARKDMVDLKDKESDAAQTRAETAQQGATAAKDEQTAKKAELAQAQQEAAAAKADAAAARNEADQARKEAAAQPGNEAAQQKAEAASQKAEAAVADQAQKDKAVEQKQAEVQKASDTVAKNEAAATADQKLADTKAKESSTERKEIAADVQKQLDDKNAAAKADSAAALSASQPAFALRITDEKALLAELVIVDLNTAKVIKTANVNSIRGRTLIDTGSGLVAVAGKKGGNAAIRLVSIDPAKLEITAQSADAIAESSALVKNGNDFYAVIEQTDGSFVIGRFDAKMETKAKSAMAVSAVTAITVTAKGILAQDAKGKIILLRPTDLTAQ